MRCCKKVLFTVHVIITYGQAIEYQECWTLDLFLSFNSIYKDVRQTNVFVTNATSQD